MFTISVNIFYTKSNILQSEVQPKINHNFFYNFHINTLSQILQTYHEHIHELQMIILERVIYIHNIYLIKLYSHLFHNCKTNKIQQKYKKTCLAFVY